MPERPVREISRAVATKRSPSLPGLMKEMLHCAATARSLCELQAKANAESASKKIKPPWAMPCPLAMCGLTVIASVASPALTCRISMPRPLLASSSCHIASAQARARSSGASAAVTFTAASALRSVAASPAGSDAKRSPWDRPGPVGTSLLNCTISRLVMMLSGHAVNDPGVNGPGMRQPAFELQETGTPMRPAAKNPDGLPIVVEARCVRLLAKADDPGAVTPAIERRGLSRAANVVL